MEACSPNMLGKMVYHLENYSLNNTYTLHKIKIEMYKNPIEVQIFLNNLYYYSEKDLVIKPK